MTSAVAALATIPGDWWIGRTVVQYDAQWPWTAMAFDDGTVIVLSVDEVIVGHWFEVFPLKFDRSLPDYLAQHVFNWIALPVPLEIFRASALWREEWQQPAQDHGEFMGAGPRAVRCTASKCAVRCAGVPSGSRYRTAWERWPLFSGLQFRRYALQNRLCH